MENLLSFLTTTHKVNLVETADRIKLEIKLTEDKGLLIGRGGEMIRSLEFIVGKISSKNCSDGREKRIYIDIDGYKNRRDESVSKRVIAAVSRVRRSRRPFALENFSAYERRIAYITLKSERGIKYETVVEKGNSKKIIISLQH